MSRARYSDRFTDLNCNVEVGADGKLKSIQHCHHRETFGVPNYEIEILKVKSCIGFFEAYKADTKLDITVRAEASAMIAEDEERLKQLRSNQRCIIL